jgi:hypothetical protein
MNGELLSFGEWDSTIFLIMMEMLAGHQKELLTTSCSTVRRNRIALLTLWDESMNGNERVLYPVA